MLCIWIAILFAIVHGQTDWCHIGHPLAEELCNTQQLIRLYTNKMSLLEQLWHKNSSNGRGDTNFRPGWLIPRKISTELPYQSYFVPPNFILADGNLIDFFGKEVGRVPGTVLAIGQAEITTSLNRQVNIVNLKKKITKELWGIEKDVLPSFWVMIRGERTLVQYVENQITLTSKSFNKVLTTNSYIIQLFRTPNSLIFICRNDFGSASLADFQISYAGSRIHIEVKDISAASMDSNNNLILLSQNTINVIDTKRNFVTKKKDVSQALKKLEIQNPKIAAISQLLFVYSENRPHILIFNMTGEITQITTVSLCGNSTKNQYRHTFTHSHPSIYIMCSAIDGFSELYEVVIPQKQSEEFFTREWQLAIVILTIIGIIIYRGSKKQKVEVKEETEFGRLKKMAKKGKNMQQYE